MINYFPNIRYLFLVSIIFILLSCNTLPDSNSKNALPTAYAGEDRIVKLNESIKFSGEGADSDGFIILYQWDLDGDGVFDKEFDYATSFTYSYTKAGIYKVTLRVTDDKGATAEDTCTIKAGYPCPSDGEENWIMSENPILNLSYATDSTVFEYESSYYMLITTTGHIRHYAVSNDGITWNEISGNEFPCAIPTEAVSSDDIELYYIDGEFVIVFSKGTGSSSIYLGKSSDGSTWTGLENPIISGLGKNYKYPSYIKTNNYERLWFIKENKVYFSQKPYNDNAWPSPNSSILDNVYNCYVLFDGKTYFMWYTTWDPKKIYLIYSTDPLFQNNITEQIIDNTGFNSIHGCSVIFNYNLYKYIFYVIGVNGLDSEILLSTCSQFELN